MKKLIAIAALASVLVLAGCAQGQASPSAGATPESAATGTVSGRSAEASGALAERSATSSAEAATESAATPESTATPESAAPPETNAPSQSNTAAERASSFVVSVGETQFAATFADTDAARALAEQLQAGPVNVSLHAYGGFEQVGPLQRSLPASDEQITTQPGDIMLYQGDQITIFTGSNSWTYTPLGHIEDATPESLLEAFGGDGAKVVLSLR